MKVKIYMLSGLLLSLLSLNGCKEESLMFEEAPAVYFTKFIVDPDSTNYSFSINTAEIVTDTLYLNMRIMGPATPNDREIKLDVMPGSTAKAGYHYKLGPLVMPGNAYQTKIPVYLYRKPGMKDSVISLHFKVAESKDFKQGYGDVIQKISRLEYKIYIDDQVLKPALWDFTLAPLFGDFSVVKFRFMMEVTGRKLWTGVIGNGEMQNYASEVRLALYNYNLVNSSPMKDENGFPITFP